MGVKKSVLGNDPLADSPTGKGIFNKTEPEVKTSKTSAKAASSRTTKAKNLDSGKKNQESRFLEDVEREKVNLRLTVEMNDWLDDLLKKGKRKHGQKIPKEIWVQAALELFRSMPVDWGEAQSPEHLESLLENLDSRIKKK